ncbi:hypothetical protein HRR83_008945 [Exophiala dermatitidis]|uniref:MFS transporter, SP family, sugar:H+ symporter n=2 Tax=Exophiala dermatitidis TaxID=5970 RepID=H6CBU7_EXODN|nr:MFS transporter, SP family, sugar:H+ symporter [Exophiala dermatitidis NIH/UT8656]KAJ4502676.1 hypothetical protein HRR75_008404 [Exophiala dermatitidis]EHY61244.1 MFS transporter, SP family, sugar:H+ symporter [Exophiala dermatitidis NIH/UT8656]KAJ4503519.1 hypothetical protein HRR73_009144 [Exophiala dermatitidis]KAJ4504121.1 hypothetical protein HRR74_009142 [Exophiala dermatitidis]KAJ4528890.1 hypothetical protein HRR76_009506 [Exophiala dermatitidis]
MNSYQLWCLIYCSFGAFFYGYDSGLTTSIIGYPEFIKYFDFNSSTLGALGSVYYAGIAIGSLTIAYLADKFGRKRVVHIACAISVTGAALQTGAVNLPMLLVGRVIGGIACGMIWSLCPLYLSELSPPHLRGSVGVLYSIVLNIAYALSEWMGLGFSYINGGQLKWRIFLGLQILIAVLMYAGSLTVCKSPRWLVAQKRDEEALQILGKLHQGETRALEDEAEHNSVPFFRREFNQIQAQIRFEQENPQIGIVAVLKRPSYRRRISLIIFFFIFQQLTAVNGLQNYQVILYKTLGLTGKTILIMVGVWGTTSLLMAIPCIYFLDHWGRRRNFFISMSIVLVSTVMLIVFWARYEASNNTDYVLGKLALWSMFMWLVGYGWVMNSFGYTYTPEILPMEIRATGMALGYASKTITTLWVVQVTPIAISNISWRFFIIFVTCDAIFLVVFYFFFPETANVPLEEVAALFGDNVVVRLEEAEKLPGQLERDIDTSNDTEKPKPSQIQVAAAEHVEVHS